MIGKSLENDFQYTKLKYKQYLYVCLNIPLMFFVCFFYVFCYYLQPKGCAHYSLLVDITHYWLLKFFVKVKFLVGTQISSRSHANVNCSEEICPVLFKQYIIHKK